MSSETVVTTTASTTTAIYGSSPGVHSIYFWVVASTLLVLALAGYFHARALKCIDEGGPDEFVENWKFRSELAGKLGFAWLLAGTAGLTGATILGVFIIASAATFAPLVVRSISRSYEQHRDVRRRTASAGK